ncbi:endonuclease/exonuclease/phosphatase family protein [Thermobifida cellulosilytica]|uniref:endonuclease/exonuclease/phosphatase family protein n=1 Tax=Thermobifida cellulosilytica TaxID=144786 RepID=UPI001E46BBA3|nr:endonuclease/exonuclease/phosphatase family protein [Thermobifida cellulosilytica]
MWLPSLITVFGEAEETPPQVVGLFALGWFLAPLPVLFLRALLARSQPVVHSPRLPLDVWFAALLAAVRLALPATDGGQPQLYLASVGVFAGLTWLAAIVARIRRTLLKGFAFGIALATLTHAALGTYAAVWRPGIAGWLLAAAQVLLFVWVLTKTPRLTRKDLKGQAADSVLCFLLLPALLVAGTVTAAPARAGAAVGWPDGWTGTWLENWSEGWPGDWADGWAAVLVTVATAVAFVVSGASATPGRTPFLPGAALVGSVAVAVLTTETRGEIPGLLPCYTVAAQAVGAVALVACLVWADWPGARGRSPRGGRAGLAVVLGGLVFLGVLYGYYAGYRLGYRADVLLVAAALLIAAVAVGHGRRKDRDPGTRVRRSVVYRWPGAALATAAAVLTALLPQFVPVHGIAVPPYGTGQASDDELRVVSYNLRMGYGVTGTYDIEGVAETIQQAEPDVVLLSEVDRGWFLTGGQDLLGVLADALDMQAVFAPAADQVWGDAVLTRLPVVETVGHPLRSYGAPVGAQALSVVVRHGETEVEVISTHLQPRPDRGDEEPTLQAADLADIVIKRAEEGRPIVVGGDFNFAPGSVAWREMERAGLYDALFRVRPSATFPADDPEYEIDHIFSTGDLIREQGAVLPAPYSDHLAVMAVLRVNRPVVYGT